MDFRLSLERKRQEKYFYCAPACGQMLLEYFYKINKKQDEIWDETRKYMVDEDNWFTDPHAYQAYLQLFDKNIFLQQDQNNINYICNSLTNSVVNNDFPVTILIYGGKHQCHSDSVI